VCAKIFYRKTISAAEQASSRGRHGRLSFVCCSGRHQSLRIMFLGRRNHHGFSSLIFQCEACYQIKFIRTFPSIVVVAYFLFHFRVSKL